MRTINGNKTPRAGKAAFGENVNFTMYPSSPLIGWDAPETMREAMQIEEMHLERKMSSLWYRLMWFFALMNVAQLFLWMWLA